MARNLCILSALLLAACATPPRTTTESERERANSLLTGAETALVAADLAGAVEPMDAARARAQLAELRALVEQSATTPVDWLGLMARVAAFVAEWQGNEPPP